MLYLLFAISDCEKELSSQLEGDDNLTTAHAVDRKLLKRHDLDFPTCVDSFDVHPDKIIRTQDSRSMGAKYLNERDVTSREDCLRMCCETPECDVFVYEEKNPGSCYLFECGPPEDFKCKFTKHSNYTSAVLAINRRMTELESQIKLTQHEHELTKLRKPETLRENIMPVSVMETTTSLPRGSKEVAQIIPTSSNVESPHHDRRCSRYQFECRNSGECIAIYNACDGIPQCSDGSDEAAELGCPMTATTQPPMVKTNHAVGESINLIDTSHKPMAGMSGHSASQQSLPTQQLTSTAVLDDLAVPILSKQYKGNQWTPQMYSQESHMNNIGNMYVPNTGQQGMIPSSLSQQVQPQPASPDFQQQPPQQLINQAKIYGREGEGLLYHPNELVQWPQGYSQEQPNVVPYHPANSGNSQIFSHKGNGLVSQSDSTLNQYEPIQNDYNRYNNYYENTPYRMMQQNSWQMMHKPHDLNAVPNAVEESMNIPMQNIIQNQVSAASGPADYYYEENFRTRMQPQMAPQRIPIPNNPVETKVKQPVQKTEVSHEESVINSESSNNSLKKAAAHHSTNATPTSKPKEAKQHEQQVQHHTSHRKMEQLTAEVTLRESSFDAELDGQNSNPSGAILSLTLGMCVTGIMLLLVGCRMRMVRRRMRRGSKSPYAHDADFLVNGMYL